VRVLTRRVRALVCAFLAVSAQSQAPASDGPKAKRNLGTSGIFLDTISGTFLLERPKWARQPALPEFVQALGGRTPKDFGLSFNCAVERSGSLRDCHTTFADPEGSDGPALTRALAPLLRLNQADTKVAVSKEYRVTVDVALQTINSDGTPIGCRRPFCIAEDLRAPPPPPQAQDPLVRERVKAANDCFSANWDKSANLRFAADKAVRENQQQPVPASVRQAVLDYVNSRTELKKCMAMLQQTAHLATITPADRKAVDAVLEWMDLNYSGQTRFEVAILIGVLDKQTGDAQLSFPGEWP
jgi:hypothetical protein